MAVYERTTWVDAPLEATWDFHSRIDGLVALTPGWLNLRVESVVGPDGEADPDTLEPGATIDLSIRPLGVGSRRSWTSRITERERDEGTAMFRDEMVDGPFRRWVHTHRFYAEEGGTRVVDRVEYALPLLGGLSAAVRPIFEPMFAYRHRRTRAELA